MSLAIQVQDLGKCYRLSHGQSGYRTLRETLTDMAMAPIRRLRNGSADTQVEDFWALKDVNFEINSGEVVGVIGRNGAGKSTFLKVLSRITKPTAGRAILNGRVGSLLEVGTGFHPELSGRENIYLNGAILGMSRREITSKFDQIVDFAEIAQFLDTPVKRYSSGMYVRLAFAVAAHLEPEILLVDEVLAVGDAAFQRKCMGKMGEVSRQGRTILFVSHNMAAITRLCRRVLWFHQGQLRESGDAEQVVSNYLAFGTEEAGEVTYHDNGQEAPGSEYVKLEAVRVRDNQDRVSPLLDIREPFTIEVQYRVLKRVTKLRVGVRLLAHDGTVLLSSTDMDGDDVADGEMLREPGSYVSRCRVPGEFLNHGQYYVSIGCDFPMVKTHFMIEQGLAFRVEQTGGAGAHISDGRSGMLRVRLPWEVRKVD